MCFSYILTDVTDYWYSYGLTLCRQSAKRIISSAKQKKQDCASDLSNPEHQNETFRMAKQMVKERQDTRNVGQCPTWWSPCLLQVVPSVQRRSLADAHY